MWIFETDEARKVREEAQNRIFAEMAEESRRKSATREAHVKATTCPHCGRHDPVPPWLIG